jgi:hypothetical protein
VDKAFAGFFCRSWPDLPALTTLMYVLVDARPRSMSPADPRRLGFVLDELVPSRAYRSSEFA